MNNLKNIMYFNKFKSYLKMNESLKEIRLNQILDKISNNIKLTEFEKEFLDNYESTSEENMMDFKMLSIETTFEKISKLLEENKKIICNLIDRDGKIGIQITKIYNNFQTESCCISLKNGEKVFLKDNKLYNILFNMNINEYSLEMEDEFYEKIPIKDES